MDVTLVVRMSWKVFMDVTLVSRDEVGISLGFFVDLTAPSEGG